MQLDRFVVDADLFRNNSSANAKPYMLVFNDNNGKMWRFECID